MQNYLQKTKIGWRFNCFMWVVLWIHTMRLPSEKEKALNMATFVFFCFLYKHLPIISSFFLNIYLLSRCSQGCSTNTFVIKWLTTSFILFYFSLISSKHCLSHTIRARELKFWENFNPPLHVICHMSSVTYHISYIICHSSCVRCHLIKS